MLVFLGNFYSCLTTLDGGRIGVAAQALGIAQGAIDHCKKYVTEHMQDATQAVLQFPGLEIRLHQRRVRVLRDGTDVPLTRLEYGILTYLASYPGIVFSREQIFESGYSLPMLAIPHNSKNCKKFYSKVACLPFPCVVLLEIEKSTVSVRL